jgi:hypothetical protein
VTRRQKRWQNTLSIYCQCDDAGYIWGTDSDCPCTADAAEDAQETKLAGYAVLMVHSVTAAQLRREQKAGAIVQQQQQQQQDRLGHGVSSDSTSGSGLAAAAAAARLGGTWCQQRKHQWQRLSSSSSSSSSKTGWDMASAATASVAAA